MSKVSKAKQFQKFLVRRVMVLEGNMEQWALADSYVGQEMMMRLQQIAAIRKGDTQAAHEFHDKRIGCLEKAVEILRSCPACGPGEAPVVEEEAACGTPDDGAGSGEPGAAAGGKPPTT